MSKHSSQKLSPADLRSLIQVSANENVYGFSTLTHGHGVIDAKQALFLLGADLADTAIPLEYYASNGNQDQLVCYPNPFRVSEAGITICEFILNGQLAESQWRIFSRRGQLVYWGR